MQKSRFFLTVLVLKDQTTLQKNSFGKTFSHIFTVRVKFCIFTYFKQSSKITLRTCVNEFHIMFSVQENVFQFLIVAITHATDELVKDYIGKRRRIRLRSSFETQCELYSLLKSI